jgi:hypothetical protein
MQLINFLTTNRGRYHPPTRVGIDSVGTILSVNVEARPALIAIARPVSSALELTRLYHHLFFAMS